MKAKICELRLDDYRGEQFWPEDLTNFAVIADMNIGPVGGVGADIFTLMVCSPKWFESNVLRPPKLHDTHEQISTFAFGRHYLFIEEFDSNKIEKAITELVNKANGRDWGELALVLSRYFAWEFEDYQNHTPAGESISE